jgi:transposase-like protein
MPRRVSPRIAKARETVERLSRSGMSVHEISRKSGVSRVTVYKWLTALDSGKVSISSKRSHGSEVVSSKASVPGLAWSEALDAAWDTRRRAGGRERYRVTLRRFAGSFAEPTDPMPVNGKVTRGRTAPCGVCIPSDAARSECPGHNAPKLPRGFVYA